MEVFKGMDKQQTILTSLAISVGLALVLFTMLMIGQTGALLGNDSEASTAVVRLGSLELMNITKEPLASGGFQASIEALPGMSIYGAAWIIAGVGLALIRMALARRSDLGQE